MGSNFFSLETLKKYPQLLSKNSVSLFCLLSTFLELSPVESSSVEHLDSFGHK